MTISRRRVPLGGRQAPLLSALVFLLAASQGVLRGQSAAELELSEKKIRPTVSRVSSSCYRALSLKGQGSRLNLDKLIGTGSSRRTPNPPGSSHPACRPTRMPLLLRPENPPEASLRHNGSVSTGDKGRPFRVTDRRRFSRDGEPLPQSRESGCEESAATAEKHTKRTHRREDEPEFLEDRLYEADSEQARSLLSLCGKAGGRAVAFGEKVFEAGRERLKNHPLKLDDIRGFVLGFHAKGLDQLIAIKGLAKMGSLGPAIGQCRVFFEAFLSIGYILKEDTEKRIRAYQK